ncbi:MULTISPECIES: hypothetical protein [unclassified Saccharopolyspora]|uniref:hypothetical protein n=1 Tax=unclassified Saccharopolyspora TaxID=2646250 RepID=UPI001CD44856|nr:MULTISPECIES: hypothetical protein [unclassified Saccharopolyspora]MCA1190698.1 hypothetical protein [Saccharopolyspora sp. 6V]MCA1278162.1 hypothetical protein [Saccharopolyspora sp. 7B]
MEPHQQQRIAELPPYRALLVVDMKDFSGEKGSDHARITEQIPLILEQAFRRRGLDEVWRSARFHGTTGDGYFAGFDPHHLPTLLDPFLADLQAELEYQNRVRPGDRPMRMRVSLTVGPMTDSGRNAISDGSGNTRIEAHRILDDRSVRDLLTRSNATTCVAAIVSGRVHDDVVEPGYTGEDPGLYVPVEVEVKTYRGQAYLRVPKPSGDLLRNGFSAPRPPEADGADEKPRGGGGGGAGPTYTGIAQAHGAVGHVVVGPDARVNTGSGHQINDARNEGDGVAVFGTSNGGVQHRVDKGDR